MRLFNFLGSIVCFALLFFAMGRGDYFGMGIALIAAFLNVASFIMLSVK